MKKRKIKILYFVEAMGGGVFTYMVNLANNLNNNFDVYIAYATRPQTPTDFKKYFNSNIHLIEVKNYKREVSFKDVSAFFEMKKIAKRVNPDVIHLHSSKSGLLGRFAFNGKKTPLFYTPHGYSFLIENISKSKKMFYRFLEKIAASRNCTTISCSYGENEETKKLTSRAVYVDNGIDLNNITHILKNMSDRTEKKKTVFTIGRISPQKDPSMFNEIAKRFPNLNFIWIGDGNLNNLLTAKNIKITGWLKANQALKIAAKCDVFVLTSLWEGLPMSLLESMYMRKICVVSNVIGNNNVIKNNVNGFLCNSLDDYCSAIKKAIYGEEKEKIKNKAYNDIITHYNSIHMAKEYMKIYTDSLEKIN